MRNAIIGISFGVLTMAALAFVLGGCYVRSTPVKGKSVEITCYSGGMPVLHDFADGVTYTSSAGVMFRSRTTGEKVNAMMDCITFRE